MKICIRIFDFRFFCTWWFSYWGWCSCIIVCSWKRRNIIEWIRRWYWSFSFVWWSILKNISNEIFRFEKKTRKCFFLQCHKKISLPLVLLLLHHQPSPHLLPYFDQPVYLRLLLHHHRYDLVSHYLHYLYLTVVV